MSNLVPQFFVMLTEFQSQLSEKYKQISSKKLLLTISGGIDSMVLLELMQKSKLKISVAHCNFGLRGEESDLDEKFVTDYCIQNNIPFYIKRFDTQKYATQNKQSIQIAARELRYGWFFELKKEHKFDYIVTAHHLDDSLETFLINLSRGTGIEGLTGIRENENIIRPLLKFSRKQIEDYATKNHTKWREDASNQSDKYLRNSIRHNIVPLLKELTPDFLNSFSKTTNYLQEVQAFSDEVSEEILNELSLQFKDYSALKINDLTYYKNYKFLLYKWLYKYGFTAWNDIYNLVEAKSGKFVETKDFRLLKNRDELILFEKNKEFIPEEFLISEDKITYPIHLQFTTVNQISEPTSPNVIYIDKNMLKFPLTVRKYKEGEYFYPFGMQGKRKKLSKFFKDEKLSILDKERIWILLSDNQVVWVIGQRLDERFKVTSNTTSILRIEYLL
ncbi:MAG: tRNA lysidine(34) synthetase TilS [Flavobacteriaceae bacterium]